jgi:hypothetical protein
LAWTVVAGLALYEASLLSFGLLLGYLGLLHSAESLVLWSLVAVLLLALAGSGVGPAWRAARTSLAGVRPRPVDVCLGLSALLMACMIGLQVAQDWTVGTLNFDSLSYHIPRALVWTWHGSFHPWQAGVWQQVGLPIGGDVLLLPGVFLGIGWLGGAWTTAWLSLGAAAAVFASTRGLGAGRRPSLIAALAFLSFPVVGLRLGDVNSDMAAAFPLLAAWVLVTRAASLTEATLLFPALCGVGVASKANVAPAVVVLAITLFSKRLREIFQDRRVLIAAAASILLAAFLCVGSYLPVLRLFGNFVGGDEGRNLISYLRGPAGVARAALFGILHWLVEPFAFVPEPPRFSLLDGLGLERAYHALGAGTRESWYPAIDPGTNQSGVFPLLALPWLLAALPKGLRLRGSLFFVVLLLAFFAPLNPNCYAARFEVVLLAAFAVLWGIRARRSLGLIAALALASLVADAVFLKPRALAALQGASAPDRNARIAAAVGPQALWLLSAPLANDAQIAGRRANVRFEYLACPPDGNWTLLFEQIRGTSPWFLLNSNDPILSTGPTYSSALGPRCPAVPVAELRSALLAAGWRLAFQENGYEVWSADRPAGPSS